MLHVGITHYLRAAPTPPREAPTERNHMSNIDRKRIAAELQRIYKDAANEYDRAVTRDHERQVAEASEKPRRYFIG